MMKNQKGMFCWNDLGTSDLESASKFYEGLFHWRFKDSKTADNRPYRVLKAEDKELGGMYSLRQTTLSSGVPPHWLPYISVDNAQETVTKARGLGAKIIKEPFDLGNNGTIAVMQDPVGAAFAIWQPKAYEGRQISEKPNTVAWNELVTRDTEGAIRFYSELFGWSVDRKKFGNIDYILFKSGDQEIGGLMQPSKEHGKVPSHWMTYFSVQDCGASTALAKKLGAKILAETMEVKDVGIISVLRDPQSAVLGLIQPKMAAEKAA